MRCTQCHLAIDFWGEHVTVTVLYRDGHREKHCQHDPFDENDPNIVAIFGSRSCAAEWQERQPQESQSIN